MCWFSQLRSQTPHFGGAHPGGLWPQIRTRSRFVYNAPTPKFHHPFICLGLYSIGSYRVDKHTHKQTNRSHWKQNTQRSSLYAKTLGNNTNSELGYRLWCNKKVRRKNIYDHLTMRSIRVSVMDTQSASAIALYVDGRGSQQSPINDAWRRMAMDNPAALCL